MYRLVLLLATILWSAAFAVPVPSERASSVLECTREFSYLDYEASDVLPALVLNNAEGEYSNNQGCLIQFRTKDFPLVFQLTFRRFDLENSWQCQWDSLCVNGQKYCGDILNNQTLQIRVPASNSVSLWFRTDSSETKPGFEVLVEAAVDNDSPVEDYEDRCRSDVEYVSDYAGSEGETENYETQYLEEMNSYPGGIDYGYDNAAGDGYYNSDSSSDYYSSEYQGYNDYDYNSESNNNGDYYNSDPSYYQNENYYKSDSNDSDSNYYNYDIDYNTYYDSNYEYYENGKSQGREEGSRRKREVKSDDNYVYDNQGGVEYNYDAYYYNYNSDRSNDSKDIDFQEYNAYDYNADNTQTDYNYDKDSYYYDSNYDYNTEYNYDSEYVYEDFTNVKRATKRNNVNNEKI